MERKCKMTKTQLSRPVDNEAESIEQMIRRITKSGEPIPENVPPIYTEKKDGIIPDYDIRTDRFNIALDATDKYTASKRAQSANRPNEEETDKYITQEIQDLKAE